MSLLDLYGPGGDTGWMAAGACVDMDSALFFPPKGWTPGRESDNREPGPYQLAREVCASCPVQQRCLEYAIAMEGISNANERGGMWGGMTPQERQEEARRRPWPCQYRHCRRMFVQAPRRQSPYCSDRCRRLEQNALRRERRELARSENRRSRHGTVSKAIEGCKCIACRRTRSSYRQDMRARALAREAAA